MNHGKSFAKGMIVGITVGGIVSMMISPMDQRRMNAIKKGVGKTMRTISSVADSFNVF